MPSKVHLEKIHASGQELGYGLTGHRIKHPPCQHPPTNPVPMGGYQKSFGRPSLPNGWEPRVAATGLGSSGERAALSACQSVEDRS